MREPDPCLPSRKSSLITAQDNLEQARVDGTLHEEEYLDGKIVCLSQDNDDDDDDNDDTNKMSAVRNSKRRILLTKMSIYDRWVFRSTSSIEYFVSRVNSSTVCSFDLD